MTDHDLDLDRAEAAARSYLAGEAAAVGFHPLDPDELKTTRRPRRPTGWLVAAACAAAALVAVPLVLRPGGPIAATPEPGSPTAGLAWTAVADPPLSPRFGAFTAWLGEEFLVLGGWTGGPCPPGAMCDLAPPDTRDGARYHPGTDTWRPIAALPTGFGRGYGTSAAALGAFYAVSYAGQEAELWRYDPAADAWQRLAAPPAWGELVGGAEALLLVTGDQSPAGYRYDPEADVWTPLPAGPLDACTGRQGLAAGARLVVVAGCGTQAASDVVSDPQVVTLDLAGGTWSEPAALAAPVQGRAVHTGGRLVWPDLLTVVSSVRSPGIYDLAAGRWYEVAVDQPPGPLAHRGMVGSTGYFALDRLGLVGADGRLLDTATGRWVEVPDPGTPQRWDPVRVAAPAALLDCFGYEYTDDAQQEGRYVPGCRLLGSPTPEPAPTTGPAAPAGSGQWRTVLELDGAAPVDPLLVEAGGRYYLMGGYLRAPDLDDVQLRRVRRFDPATGAWQDLADLPEAAVSQPYTLAADVAGELIYVHLSFEELGELWAYDTGADRWTKVGATDETEHHLGTEDGLVRVRLPGEGTDGATVELLAGGRRQPLPAPPAASGPVRLVRLDDHGIALVAGERVAVLDTATRQWGDWSEPAAVADLVVTGVDGAAVFADTAAPAEREPTDSRAPEVALLRDGTWSQVFHPFTGEAPTAGLTPATGPAVGPLAVVQGRFLDTRTGEWLAVPTLPGADRQWRTRHLAAGPDGILTCFPERGSVGEALAVPACYFLPAG